MRCTATAKSGRPCTAAAVVGGTYCFTHDPALAEVRDAARKKGGAARRDQLRGREVPCLKSAADIRTYLNRVLADTAAGLINPNAARAIANLCKVQLVAVSDAFAEQRHWALEGRH